MLNDGKNTGSMKQFIMKMEQGNSNETLIISHCYQFFYNTNDSFSKEWMVDGRTYLSFLTAVKLSL